ncbi:MAG TPA: glycosyltransferase [Opitutaceae bacterium]|nr:glycosyltransferase [Opitutaceae bacterium]
MQPSATPAAKPAASPVKGRNILFVSGFLPSNRVPSGGQKLVSRVLDEIAADNNVTLLAFSNEKETEHLVQGDFKRCKEVKVFTVSRQRRAFAAVRHPQLPLVACARYSLARDWMADVLESRSFDLAWFEFIQCAALISSVPKGMPTRLVVHDLFYQAHERKAARASGPMRALWKHEARRTRLWEATTIASATEVFTLTEKDRYAAEKISGRNDIVVRYPEVEQIYHTIRKIRGPHISRGMILFWGQMSRTENEDAVVWFVQEILPSIRLARPHARLVIAGANPGQSVMRLACDHVEVTGFVPDPIPIFQAAEIAVAPLRLGAGIKIKVAEYVAAGVPTVVTSIGAEGIRPSHLLHVSDQATGLIKLCVNLLAPENE